MSQDEVRVRVEAFVADFYRRWERAGRAPSDFTFAPAIFEAWTRELAELVGTHFTVGASTGAEGSLSGTPAHDPSGEFITGVEVEADHAIVRSMIQSGGMPTYYEYRLERTEGQWRINQVLSSSTHPELRWSTRRTPRHCSAPRVQTLPCRNFRHTLSSTSRVSSPKVDWSPPSAKPCRSR